VVYCEKGAVEGSYILTVLPIADVDSIDFGEETEQQIDEKTTLLAALKS